MTGADDVRARLGALRQRLPKGRKGWLLGGGVVLLLVLVVLGWPATPEPELYAHGGAGDARAMLARAGVEHAIVDVQPGLVLVRYEVPAGAEPDATWPVAMAAARFAAPEVARIVVQEYRNLTPAVEYRVLMADFDAYYRGELTPEEFEARMTRTAFA